MYFFHCYSPDAWDGFVKNGLIRKNAGIRFCQSLELDDELKFNNLAKKGGELYKLLEDKKCPFYIDRLQGGCYIESYPFNMELVDEYKKMLGENFWGFQIHELMSNYRSDSANKLGDVDSENWTEENISKAVFEKYPGKNLFLESMTLEEMAAFGKPDNLEKFYNNITAIYKKRLEQVGTLLPCNSFTLSYKFELSCGTKRICPEVGAQTPDARIQICYARGLTREEGKSFGVYYEPWGGNPFSTCTYFGIKNEWGINESSDFPFKALGPNGGSSRSLQMRIFLYAYLNNAEFIAEEWGLYNTFAEGTDYELSPYGIVKRDFLDFCDKYSDVGEKIVPAAVVIPETLMVFDLYEEENRVMGFEIQSDLLNIVKNGVYEIFSSSAPVNSYEGRTLKNFIFPDAVDMLNRDDTMLGKYEYLVDLTGDADFKEKHKNICEIKDLKDALNKSLPCSVEGNIHWIVNRCTSGGYYLTVFNNDGVKRSVAGGESVSEESTLKTSVSFKSGAKPTLLEGNAELVPNGNDYTLTVRGGSFAFIKF